MPDTSSRTMSTSMSLTSSGLSALKLSVPGHTRSGLKFAKRSNFLRNPRMTCFSASFHFGSSCASTGPPTAPKRIASAFSHMSIVSSGKCFPDFSNASPPALPSKVVISCTNRLLTASKTSTADLQISGPIPSPGTTAIFPFIPLLLCTTPRSSLFARCFSAPIEGGEECAERRSDDVGVDADAPKRLTFFICDLYIGDRARILAFPERVFFIGEEGVVVHVGLLQSLAERVYRAIALARERPLLAVHAHCGPYCRRIPGLAGVLDVEVLERKGFFEVDVLFLERALYHLRQDFSPSRVGDALYQFSKLGMYGFWRVEAELGTKDVRNAAFS